MIAGHARGGGAATPDSTRRPEEVSKNCVCVSTCSTADLLLSTCECVTAQKSELFSELFSYVELTEAEMR